MIVQKKQRISVPLHNMIKVQFSFFSPSFNAYEADDDVIRKKKICPLKCLGNTGRKLCWLQKHVSYLIRLKLCFHVSFFFMHMELDYVIKNVKTCHNKRLGNTVCSTDYRNRFHIVLMPCALIHTASVA
jgi:hypothetical protein